MTRLLLLILLLLRVFFLMLFFACACVVLVDRMRVVGVSFMFGFYSSWSCLATALACWPACSAASRFGCDRFGNIWRELASGRSVFAQNCPKASPCLVNRMGHPTSKHGSKAKQLVETRRTLVAQQCKKVPTQQKHVNKLKLRLTHTYFPRALFPPQDIKADRIGRMPF